jgi:hypothetical protein
MSYYVGNRLKFRCTFTLDGVPTDPTTVRLSLRCNNRDATQYTPTRTGAGVYEQIAIVDRSGSWYWAWVGEGTVPARAEGSFAVIGDETL